MSYFKDLSGARFGRLTAISRSGVSVHGQVTWNCHCDCGGEKVVPNGSLTSGSTQSCGCLSREKKAERVAQYRHKHGHATGGKTSPTYFTWQGMVSRCSDKARSNYKYYGGAGVKVCERWLEFANFLEDMGDRPDGMTLDRIDPFGDCHRENCRWADKKTQARNKRVTKDGGGWAMEDFS